MKDCTTIGDLLEVYPNITAVDEVDFCKHILNKLLEKYGERMGNITEPDKCKWRKYAKRYLKLGGKMEDLKKVK